jgi:hypothetical protein
LCALDSICGEMSNKIIKWSLYLLIPCARRSNLWRHLASATWKKYYVINLGYTYCYMIQKLTSATLNILCYEQGISCLNQYFFPIHVLCMVLSVTITYSSIAWHFKLTICTFLMT